MAELDIEAKAIAEIAGIVGGLEEEQRGRVLRYIQDRFNITGTQAAMRKDSTGVDTGKAGSTPSEFEDFASLVDACNPTTDSMRSLVAGYWLQVCLGGQGFDGQSANKELKHLGHPSANITTALGALIHQRPALVLQLRKSGNSKQARKLYKVTEAGIRQVKAMMSAKGDAE